MSSKTSSKRTSATVKKRPMIAAKERGPGPGRYALPSTFGYGNTDKTRKGVPAFSFGARIADRKKLQTPGPNYIDPKMSRYGTTSMKASTITGRPKSLKSFQAPGPGSYSQTKKQKDTPAYSMGQRIKELKKADTPAPSAYDTTKVTTSKQKASQSYSMSGRLKVGGFADDKRNTPAPGSYSTTLSNKKKSPAFSMGGRTYMPDPGTETPGPGQHSPEKSNITKKSTPAFSLGVKHSEYITPLIIDVPEN
eukprot:m.24873 g.24873  ORF g.24873 m.24873 type:complete len:250 (-) comp9143_c0_seq1:294-1043(-)